MKRGERKEGEGKVENRGEKRGIEERGTWREEREKER